ncbi:YrzI family small protein [Evansella tamaricis]|uniref:YrzI family small protein n=1 Tax=Evansella tamaricis TaxID=2069301 RepID=A0ABS6JHB2_9BACI|nr:YrzI family small protein [Evansella tamaricis]MBU9713016.1 YrzI family small protein [Evansella tamaricis]
MMFHLLFITVKINKRRFTNEDIQREARRSYANKLRQDVQSKQAEYTRLI